MYLSVRQPEYSCSSEIRTVNRPPGFSLPLCTVQRSSREGAPHAVTSLSENTVQLILVPIYLSAVTCIEQCSATGSAGRMRRAEAVRRQPSDDCERCKRTAHCRSTAASSSLRQRPDDPRPASDVGKPPNRLTDDRSDATLRRKRPLGQWQRWSTMVMTIAMTMTTTMTITWDYD